MTLSALRGEIECHLISLFEHFQILPFLHHLVYGHFILFLWLLFVATVGKAFGFRRAYVFLLDKIFTFAAFKLNDVEGEEEENEQGVTSYEPELIICPEQPVIRNEPKCLNNLFALEDSLPYTKAAIKAIVDDDINRSFTPQELTNWNMLTRTKRKYRIFKSQSVTSLWVAGFLVRYLFLLPVRLTILAISLLTLVICTFLVGKLPDNATKRKLNAITIRWCLDFVANSLSVAARFHNKENRPGHGIAVANHTSPIDSMLLATDNCYDMVGQKTDGFLGVFMKALSKSSTHIWFERTNAQQRTDLSQRLSSRTQNKSLPPVLIFPEGICVNNTAVLLFKKGVFELGAEIHPIAIKFDSRYGDPFWYQDNFFPYCLSMMTSWAIVCDVWYLPPMKKRDQETSVGFAARVQSAIAQKGGMTELNWNGVIKIRSSQREKRESKEEIWLKRQQLEYANHLRQRLLVQNRGTVV